MPYATFVEQKRISTAAMACSISAPAGRKRGASIGF